MTISFNKDGSLAVKKKVRRDHIPILASLDEIPFGLGKKLLTQHLQGIRNAKTARLRFDKMDSFGQLAACNEEEIAKLINFVEKEQLVQINKEKGVYSVLVLTQKGLQELELPSLEVSVNDLQAAPDRLELVFSFPKTTISAEEKKLFSSLEDFFPLFSQQQRKAVVCQKPHILCVAGAGSGKTSVLSKRIEFLVKYKSVSPKKILAITFTRKARREMMNRLDTLLPNNQVMVETFNSFCEKFLKKNEGKFNRVKQMISLQQQLKLFSEVAKKEGYTPEQLMSSYYTLRQRQGKDSKSLWFSLHYDFQSLVERVKFSDSSCKFLEKSITNSGSHSILAKSLLRMTSHYITLMEEAGLRDFADQLVDAIHFMKNHKNHIPSFDHVLVDEYQDVNDIQIELLRLLKPENLFVVGDPRQSIYGWRGSRLQHILDFPKDFDAEVVQLTHNYRSCQEVINVCNVVASKTGCEAMAAGLDIKGKVFVQQYASEELQAASIAQQIKSFEGNKKDIFVLSRTNKGLNLIQQQLDILQIPYLLRTDEQKKLSTDAGSGQVTLATVHAIKGLEAKRVYVINTNTSNFPCKASDHPVMELFNISQDYDSYAEELRVLYVALSRAEKELIISYTSTPSKFLPKNILTSSTKKTNMKATGTDSVAALMKLRQWRYGLSKEKGCPAYVVCSDKTLEELVALRPQSIEELYSVTGMGKSRVREFGDELLNVLQKI